MASHACTENAVKAQAFAKDELSNRRSGVNGGDFAIVEMQFQSNHRAFRHAKQFTKVSPIAQCARTRRLGLFALRAREVVHG